MITANEAAVITRCLDSAVGAFDELCLVRAIGTTAPDETVEIARAWSEANHKDFKFAEYQNSLPGWPHTDNFGAARQMSFDIASGDFWLWLDCDDVIDPETCAKIRECSQQDGINAHHFGYAKPDGSTCMRERLIRRGFGHWKNRVHENVVLHTTAESHRPDISVHHAPLIYDSEKSHARNYALLRLETDASARYLFYLHEELYWLVVHRGLEIHREEAIATGQAALHLFGGGGMEERYEIYLNLGELDPAHDETWFDQALRLQPWRREALSYLCQRAVRLGHRSWALSWFRMMDALPRPNPLPWTHREIWYGWARNYLRVRVLRCAGQSEKADAEHAEHMKDSAYSSGVAKYESPKQAFSVVKTIANGKALIMCPTRGRPERCARMIESFSATRQGNTELICYVAEDDPQIEAYRAYANAPRSGKRFAGIRFEFGPRITIVRVFNKCLEHEADFYGEINDDHIYHTEGWDVKLESAIIAHGRGMAYGRTENLPSGVMISADCVRALGYFHVPCFQHQYCDNAMRDLYNSAGLLIHVPEVWIEHCHPVFGKATPDETYGAMAAAGPDDAKAYERWRRDDFQNHLAKLIGAVNPT